MNSTIASMLIESYSKAAVRTRKVFIILNVISIIYVVGYFNYKLTWLRHKDDKYISLLMEKDNLLKQHTDTLAYRNQMDISAREKLLIDKYNVDFRFINFDLIGTKVYIEDLPLLGSIALSIIITWFFYCIRRETGIVKEINTRFQKEPNQEIKDYLFYGVSFNIIFNTIKNVDEEKVTVGQLMSIYIRRFLLFMPTLVLFVICAFDFWETFFSDSDTWNMFLKFWTRFEIVMRMFIPSVLLLYCYLQTLSILKFSREDSYYRDLMQKKYWERPIASEFPQVEM